VGARDGGDAADELIEPETRDQGIVAMPPRVALGLLVEAFVESAADAKPLLVVVAGGRPTRF
jgi:hypothetical protein